MEKDIALDIKFKEAVDKVNAYHEPLPADILLRLYAYYKIANKNFDNPGSRKPLINAFKTNALFQAKDVTEEEAKEKYIALVEQYIDS
jgi:diazepam-binding inhibitor (GABA receptor modulating acyl-CoA-binding protein)